MIEIRRRALSDALPAASELSTPIASPTLPPEQLRLAPMDLTASHVSPWRPAAPLSASPASPLFESLRARALDVARRPHDAQLRQRLDAVVRMTDRLGELAALSARVERERGRWLRA